MLFEMEKKTESPDQDYFKNMKRTLQGKIPDFSSPEFKRMRDSIVRGLKSKESDFLILIRRLKVLLLADWYDEKKRGLLLEIKNNLLKNGIYAETIDNYYDMGKKGGLSQIQVLEECCIKHQLIVLIDGDGKGTLTEQNYLCDNYIFHGKTLFFIRESKFNEKKDNPSEYFKDFPTIITYEEKKILDEILTYVRLRLYRLAAIIQKQASSRKGPHGSSYMPWKRRLKIFGRK